MKYQCKNGNIIETLPSNNNVRSFRSNFISCVCYDIKAEEFVFVHDLDIRKPFDRFIPEWYLIQEGVIK